MPFEPFKSLKEYPRRLKDRFERRTSGYVDQQ